MKGLDGRRCEWNFCIKNLYGRVLKEGNVKVSEEEEGEVRATIKSISYFPNGMTDWRAWLLLRWGGMIACG